MKHPASIEVEWSCEQEKWRFGASRFQYLIPTDSPRVLEGFGLHTVKTQIAGRYTPK